MTGDNIDEHGFSESEISGLQSTITVPVTTTHNLQPPTHDPPTTT